MPAATCCLTGRLPADGKFWLKHARIDAACLDGDTPAAGPDGTLLADLRIEDGRIRAILPAGDAPCCARGLDLDGRSLAPLIEGGRIGAGQPADLTFILPKGRRVEMRGGTIVQPAPTDTSA